MVHTMEVVVKPRLDAVVVRPGDTVIVRMAAGLSQKQFSEFADEVKGRLPEVHFLFMTAEQMLVYRPDGGED